MSFVPPQGARMVAAWPNQHEPQRRHPRARRGRHPRLERVLHPLHPVTADEPATSRPSTPASPRPA